MHQQQAAAGQEAICPGRLAGRGHPDRQVRGEPAGRLGPWEHARVGEQPDRPANQQPVHVRAAGQHAERAEPPVLDVPAALVLGEQAQRGLHPVQRAAQPRRPRHRPGR